MDLIGLWLNDYLDPSDSVRLPMMPGWQEGLEIPGDVQAFAGGTFRAILDEGAQTTLTPEFRLMDATLVAQVKRRAGRQQWVRTSTGLKFSAIYLKPQITWVTRGGGHRAQVKVTFTEITGSEVV
ncbi:hypothetical protein [Enterococcus hirae]|uniref:hypothetical protein n=1 Tax=Enterococcus hirae TaxID=1354 RepID=UPI001370BA54|nr:hypothetical protein [Enterococcus hirae]NAE18084.1 hypothetical protein [Enterococcus hirae]